MAYRAPRPATLSAVLADRLLAEGRIQRERHEAAVAYQRRTSRRIEDCLLEVDAMPEAELLKYLAALHKTRFVSTERLARASIDRATLDKVPKKLAERYLAVPVVYDAAAQSLSIVLADPGNVDALDQIQKGSGAREVKALVARPAAIEAAVNKLYHGEPFAFAALEKGGDRGGGFELSTMIMPGAPSAGYATDSGPDLFSGPALGAPPTPAPPDAARPSSKVPVLVLDAPSLPAPAPPRHAPAEVPTSHPSPGPGARSEDDRWASSDACIETLNVLVTLLENSRPDLRGHSAQVARFTRKLAERLGYGPAEINPLVAAAYLHDLGKMQSYHLTALNVSEYEAPRGAALKAYSNPSRLMRNVKLDPTTVGALENMYERFDGKGLPNEAEGKQIPIGARILAVTDTYVDLVSNTKNPFRKILKPIEACEVMAKYRGVIFDPSLLDLFRAIVAGDDLRSQILSDRHVALLVDPDPEETTVLELRMLEEGFEVRIARSAVQARKILETGEIELVVSELDLGSGEDGLQLLSAARGAKWGKELPWLVLTRRQGRAETQQTFALGVVDYVIKPAATEVLVTKLKQALEKRMTASPGRGVSGSLAEMALPDLVQILWHGRKSGALRLRHASDSGEVHFSEGKVVDAMWGKLRGEEAFYAMLHVTEGEFALDPNYRTDAVAITTSPEALLLEGMRRMDEG
jgi:response regulator RpfG family c-di-GMP phosphodiesterase